MSANPKNLRLHPLAEEDALVQTDDGNGIFAPANRDPNGQGHNEFTQTNLVSDGFVPAANIDPNLVNPNEFTQTNLVSEASFGANAQGAGGQLTVTRHHGSPFELVSKIVFASTRDHLTGDFTTPRGIWLAPEIYLMNPDGTNPQRLTSNNYGDSFPILSPDGEKIVFNSNRLTADSNLFRNIYVSDLFVMELTPRVYSAEATGFLPDIEQTLLTRGCSATWSPDSKNITFHASASYYASGGTETGYPTRTYVGAPTTDSDIFVANVDELAAAPDVLTKTQLATNITNTRDQIEDDPDWSPDGQSIVFTSDPFTDDPNLSNQAEIYVMNPDGTGRTRLTNNNYEERGPSWSPDGTRILFAGRIGGGSNDFEICVMNADGTGFQQLTDNTVSDLVPSWSPDGTQIAFHRQLPDEGPQMFTMNADGTDVTQVTFPPGTNRLADWGEVRTRVGSVVPGDLGAYDSPPAATLAVTGNDNEFTQTNLVSDIPGVAGTLDPNLVNPWGIALSSTSPFWVSDNGTGLTTVYDGAGNILDPTPLDPNSTAVTIATRPGQTTPATPTGDVFNIAGNGFFNITSGGVTGSSRFIFATEDGTISGWNPSVNPTSTVIAVDHPGAVYKGLAIGTNAEGTFLYATNFSNGTVDVFDSKFQPVNSFTDPTVGKGFAPFGVQVLGGNVFVTFAKQDAQKQDDVAGPANGYVDEFSMDGQLLERIATRAHLDSPWGLAIAPPGFGQFANDLLVGNFGDGTIDVFDLQTDRYLGKLDGTDGKPIQIDGLWALMPGNNGLNSDPHSIYFTAGPEDEQHGLFGSLTASVDTGDSASLSQSLLNLVQSADSLGANAQSAGSVTASGDLDPMLQGFLANGAHHQ